MNYEFWDRDSLYEEVWTTPMAKLARKPAEWMPWNYRDTLARLALPAAA